MKEAIEKACAELDAVILPMVSEKAEEHISAARVILLECIA